MSKTFKSTVGGFSIGIHPVTDGVQFRITNMRGNYQQFTTPSSVAAEQALAILEAAGYTEDDTEGTTGLTHFALAMSNLRAGIEEQKRATAEAEAEALELFNQYRIATQLEPIDSWAEAHPLAREQWLAVARRARELNKEEK